MIAAILCNMVMDSFGNTSPASLIYWKGIAASKSQAKIFLDCPVFQGLGNYALTVSCYVNLQCWLRIQSKQKQMLIQTELFIGCG